MVSTLAVVAIGLRFDCGKTDFSQVGSRSKQPGVPKQNGTVNQQGSE